MFDKNRFWFLVFVAIFVVAIPMYMINKYGFIEYAQKKLENRMENRQKLVSAIGL